MGVTAKPTVSSCFEDYVRWCIENPHRKESRMVVTGAGGRKEWGVPLEWVQFPFRKMKMCQRGIVLMGTHSKNALNSMTIVYLKIKWPSLLYFITIFKKVFITV